jgi:prolyl 4-hydroxylase
LNDTDNGGHTDFPKLGLKIRPKKGMAALWYDTINGKEDFRTFHAGLPPQTSIKFGLNIWVREKPFA